MRTETEIHAPAEPESIEQTGLAESTIEHLILKILYTRGELYGGDLSRAIGLMFSVIQDILEVLKLQHLVSVKRSLGVGNVSAIFVLSDAGHKRARELMEADRYVGTAPVSLEQYAAVVKLQKLPQGWLTKEALAKAFQGLVVTENTISQIGPAISSGTSLLVYGKPGDGKSALIEALANLDGAPIFVPHAIECQGNVIQVFDPVYHQAIEEEEPSVLSFSREVSHDRRWVKCKRPFIMSGGELSLDMLDLRYNQTSKIYEAPFQLKANNGIYLIDDFGRQRATPAEVLNRWIVPMERRVDYLGFLSGGKMSVPFETFLVFSTNLNPAALGDEAFLRRMQYKLLLRGPAENEFIRIFESYCSGRGLTCPREMVMRFVKKFYRDTGKVFRRCQPRDVLSHAIDLIQFERLPFELTEQLLDRAFESCFLQDEEAAPPQQDEVAAPPQQDVRPVPTQTCAAFWGDQLAQIKIAFEILVYFAAYRDAATGKYQDADSGWQYGEAETERVLSQLHRAMFMEWVHMTPEQQSRDLARYLAGAKQPLERFHAAELAPADASPQQLAALARSLELLSHTGETDRHVPIIEIPLTAPLEKIA
jgi:hypothetical protein